MSWNSNNDIQVLRSSNPNPVIPQIGGSRNVPLLPPRPTTNIPTNMNNYSYNTPYSSYGYGNSYNSLGYRGPMYGSYGYGNSYGYGAPGLYGMDNYSSFGPPRDDAERRFIQFAEASSRDTFANVESIVRAVNSMSMMLDNTFFAMTSSFRAILSVAENFGRLRNMFGHIWYSLNIFRLMRWLYRRVMKLMGYKVMDSAASIAWREAYTTDGAVAVSGPASGGQNWPTVAFLGVLISAPYFISKFLLPKFEDKYNPEKWKSPGIRAKAAFDFTATSPNELSLRINDQLLIAPTYLQEEMKLTNSGWAFAICDGKSGLIPLNYVVLCKRNNNGVLKNGPRTSAIQDLSLLNINIPPRNNIKRVSFGENQIIESNGTERIVKIPDTKDEVTSEIVDKHVGVPELAGNENSPPNSNE